VVSRTHIAGLFWVLEAEQGHFVVVQRDVAVAAEHLLIMLASSLLPLFLVYVKTFMAPMDVVHGVIHFLLVLLYFDHFVL
jgi:hypothetical protein